MTGNPVRRVTAKVGFWITAPTPVPGVSTFHVSYLFPADRLDGDDGGTDLSKENSTVLGRLGRHSMLLSWKERL